jgi:nitrite reductase/ring-hydroxylating ferredoxin subunit
LIRQFVQIGFIGRILPFPPSRLWRTISNQKGIVGSGSGRRRKKIMRARLPCIVVATVLVVALLLLATVAESFTLVMMGRKRGGLQDLLNNKDEAPKGISSLNRGLGQEITGVTLPAEVSESYSAMGDKYPQTDIDKDVYLAREARLELRITHSQAINTCTLLLSQGKIKGWEFGEGIRVACAQVDGKFYAIQGVCPRCGFDLWKGDVIATDAAGFEDLPRVACPTCSTTYSMRTGRHGPPLKRTGLQGFVAGLAKSATMNDAGSDVKAFTVTRDEDTGKVYCR